jgi:hypothetical protein
MFLVQNMIEKHQVVQLLALVQLLNPKFSMASRSPGNKNNLIYIKFRRFNNGLLPSSGKSMWVYFKLFK